VSNLLLQPHPCDWTFAGYARNIGAISLGIFFILAVMQPFEINLLPTSEALKIGFAFGMLMMVVGMLMLGWTRVFPAWFAEKSWTLGKQMIWSSSNFLLVALANMLLGSWLLPHANIFSHFGVTLFITLVVGLLPYLLMTFISHNQQLKRYAKQAATLSSNVGVPESTPEGQSEAPLPFLAEDGILPPIYASDWLFLEAEGNYLRIWVRKESGITDFRLRSTLKEQELALANVEGIFRSHRAFLINLKQVQSIEGNAAGYRLTLDPSIPPVPVSRSRTKAFQAAFGPTPL